MVKALPNKFKAHTGRPASQACAVVILGTLLARDRCCAPWLNSARKRQCLVFCLALSAEMPWRGSESRIALSPLRRLLHVGFTQPPCPKSSLTAPTAASAIAADLCDAVCTQVVVQGIPWAYTDQELAGLFHEVGTVEQASVVYSKDGRSRVRLLTGTYPARKASRMSGCSVLLRI